MFLWGRFWFRRVAYGYERMSSLVPELVKKRCITISAESNDSVNVSSKSLLMNAYRPVTSGHFAVASLANAFAGSFATAVAA